MSGVGLVTVSREYASGGGGLARALGARLGWRVLDHEIAHAAARRLALPDDTTAANDERAAGLLERIGEVLLRGSPDAWVVPSDELGLDPDDIAAAVRAFLLDEAQRPPLIVVGHGGQFLFAARADALHLRVVAPPALRLARARARLATDEETAAGELRRRDEMRAAYLRHHYGGDGNDPARYDLVVNLGRLAVDEAVALVEGLVTARGGRSPA